MYPGSTAFASSLTFPTKKHRPNERSGDLLAVATQSEKKLNSADDTRISSYVDLLVEVKVHNFYDRTDIISFLALACSRQCFVRIRGDKSFPILFLWQLPLVYTTKKVFSAATAMRRSYPTKRNLEVRREMEEQVPFELFENITLYDILHARVWPPLESRNLC